MAGKINPSKLGSTKSLRLRITQPPPFPVSPMPLLVIGNKNYSSWSLRPWLLLRHFAIPFEEKRLNLDTPEFHAEIGRWSPTKRVPVLHDEGLLVWDSLAICEYVNDR